MTLCGYCLVGLPARDHPGSDYSGIDIIICPQLPPHTMYLSNPDRQSVTVTNLGDTLDP